MMSFQWKMDWITIGWMNQLMWKAFKKGLTSDDIVQLEDCKINAEILDNLWTEEKKAENNSSLSNAVLKFAKKNLIANMCLMIFASITQFLGPVFS